MTARTQRRSTALNVLLISVLAVWMVLAAFPFLWTLWGSFKVEGDFFSKADWVNALTGPLTLDETGSTFTGAGYYGAWIKEAFGLAAINTVIVCLFVVTISLTFGTLGGYALSRSTYRYTFWFLIIALIFRAMPPITLVSGYLPVFFKWNLWGQSVNSHCCTGGDQPAVHFVDVALLLQEYSQGSGRERHGRWL